MGAGVSNWRLAQAVSRAGQMGVVSGTALDSIMIRRLQVGDIGGHIRRALEHFPLPEVAERVIERYFVDGGKAPDAPFALAPFAKHVHGRRALDLLVAGNFVEVFLAKEGHDRPVGINYLAKIQLHIMPSLFGAMLAGVNCAMVGAGIPKSVPGVMDQFAAGLSADMRFDLRDGDGMGSDVMSFDPVEYFGGEAPTLNRPEFFAIIASAPLATMLVRKSNGKVDGLIVEGPTAGGHNAPPRGRMSLDDGGEPIYGERDIPDFKIIRELGLPFYLAGGQAEPEHLAEALALGASGVQIGTPFAFCEESGFDPEIKRKAIEMSVAGKAHVFTDPVASPTGFPFKVLEMEGSLSDNAIVAERKRVCDIGCLREQYRRANGTVGHRCSSEPATAYLSKGGKEEDLVGRKCLCNALLANIGLAQSRDIDFELPLVTSGDDVAGIARFLASGRDTYSAAEVLSYMLG